MAKTKAQPAKGGRPSLLTDELAETICRRLANGESLRTICAEPRMPDKDTVRRWCRSKPGFYAQYRRAREDQADSLVEEALEKARDAKDRESAACAKVLVDAVKWAAARMKPKAYGDRVSVEHSGPDGGEIQTRTKVVKTFDYDDLARELSDAQLERDAAAGRVLPPDRN